MTLFVVAIIEWKLKMETVPSETTNAPWKKTLGVT